MNRRRSIWTRIRISLLVLAMTLTAATLPVQAAWSGNGLIEGSRDFIEEMYLDGATDDQLLIGALRGMFETLDDYSVFYDREEASAFQSSLSGSFVGIGISMETNDAGVIIMDIFEDSPAEAAGLHSGDIITHVDGTSIAGLELTAVATRVRGEENTTVKITYLRKGVSATVDVVRRTIRISPVSWQMDGTVGVISISTFNANTADDFTAALNAVKEKGAKRLILDLRDNGGGYVDQAAKVAQQLVPKGLITKVDFKSEQMQDYSYHSDLKNPGLLMAVLVNENSASATEILASAIQDAGNGVLVGKKTFGKGIVQSIFNVLTAEAYDRLGSTYKDTLFTVEEWGAYYGVAMPDTDILGTAKITTGQYLTRNGRKIHGIGLTPEYAAENRSPVHGIDVTTLDPISSTTMKSGAYEAQVSELKRILIADGRAVGTLTDDYDSETTVAVTAFQRDNGLKATGIVDASTLAGLNARMHAIRIANDPQYAQALRMMNALGN